MNLIFFLLGAGFATGIHFVGWMAIKKHRREVRRARQEGQSYGYQQGARATALEWETWAKDQRIPPLVPSIAYDKEGILKHSGKTVTRGGLQHVMQDNSPATSKEG